jgi:hypothetical protein
MPKKNGLNLIASQTIQYDFQLYKTIDFLNKSLKSRNLIFGLKLNENEETMTICIYES